MLSPKVHTLNTNVYANTYLSHSIPLIPCLAPPLHPTLFLRNHKQNVQVLILRQYTRRFSSFLRNHDFFPFPQLHKTLSPPPTPLALILIACLCPTQPVVSHVKIKIPKFSKNLKTPKTQMYQGSLFTPSMYPYPKGSQTHIKEYISTKLFTTLLPGIYKPMMTRTNITIQDNPRQPRTTQDNSQP